MLCGICIDPYNWTGLPTIDLLSERIDKIRGKTHSTSSQCAACKLNTVERSDDLSNELSFISANMLFIFDKTQQVLIEWRFVIYISENHWKSKLLSSSQTYC